MGKMWDGGIAVLCIRHTDRDPAVFFQPARNFTQSRVLKRTWPHPFKHTYQLTNEQALKTVFSGLRSLHIPRKPAQKQIGIPHIQPHQFSGVIGCCLCGDEAPAAAVQLQYQAGIHQVNFIR